jgi:hypothetical protein
MKGPTILGVLVISVMSALMANILINDGMDHGVGFDVFNAGASNPWQLFINNDLVTGLLFMCGWMLFREKGGRVIDTVCWIWMVMWWGNIIVAAYVLRAVWQSEGDWNRFFLGRRAGALRPIGFALPWRGLSVLLAVAVALWTAGGDLRSGPRLRADCAHLFAIGRPGPNFAYPLVLCLHQFSLPTGGTYVRTDVQRHPQRY